MEKVDPTSKEGRKKCWKARDKLFFCLDHTILEKQEEECKSFLLEMQNLCPPTWVRLF